MKNKLNDKFYYITLKNVAVLCIVSVYNKYYLCRCHGEEGNIVHDIVKDMNLLSSSEMFLNNEILISDGTTVSKDISKKLEEIYLKIAINEDDIIDPDLSVGQYVTNKYKENIF